MRLSNVMLSLAGAVLITTVFSWLDSTRPVNSMQPLPKPLQISEPLSQDQGISLTQTCETIVVLDNVAKGISGWIIEVEAPVVGTSTAIVTISRDKYPVQTVIPVQRITISGMDLNNVVKGVLKDEVLVSFELPTCPEDILIRQLDNDEGGHVIEPGTVISP